MDCVFQRTVDYLKKRKKKKIPTVMAGISIDCLMRDLLYPDTSTCKDCELNGVIKCNDRIVGDMLEGLK